jgi:hypothetical protein
MRHRRKNRTFLIGIVAGSALASVLVILAISAIVGTRAGREGEKWTFRELNEHLNARGVRCNLVNCNDGVLLYDPDIRANETRRDQDAVVRTMWDFQRVMPHGAVVVMRHRTPEMARQYAGDASEAEKNHHWGLFTFYGDPDMIIRIARVLR